MNVKMNMKLSSIKSIDKLYIPPSPDDSSQSMGAVLYQNHLFGIKNEHINSAYLGFDFSNISINTIKNTFHQNQYHLHEKKPLEIAAKMLFEGKVIAKVSGKAEFGARALGNRSILAHPSIPGVVKKINKTIKNRDFWMPFAAVVLDSHSKTYFNIKGDNNSYKYMTMCSETKSYGRKLFSNAIHNYDLTCRPQILSYQENPSLYKLIKFFGDQSGSYGLLNTSLNFHGKPIINDLKDCKEIIDNSELDAILINEILIVKK